MKVLIDTNIVLDLLCDRAGFSKDAQEIAKMCELNKIEGHIAAVSIPNIIYIMRKQLDNEKTAEIINKLFLIFKVEDLKADDFKKALKLGFDDFEDALQVVTAMRIKADCIITRNLKDFKKSAVAVKSPKDFLKKN